MKESELPWIMAGYLLFSRHGPDALKVERLAKKAGISKSSFYHHFASLEIFEEELLKYHIDRIAFFSGEIHACKNMLPDLAEVLSQHVDELLFNRQLRIHRSQAVYRLCFEKSISYIDDGLVRLWADMLGITDLEAARNMLNVARDSFYHRMTQENLTREWITAVITEMKEVFSTLAGKGQGE